MVTHPKRSNAIVTETVEQSTKRLRTEYQQLSAHDKAEQHEHYQSLCEGHGVDFWLIICNDVAFKNTCTLNDWN